MIEEGIPYSVSLFTKWQKGECIPDRRTVLILIGIFVARGGIYSADEANELLVSAHHTPLSPEEIIEIKKSIKGVKKYVTHKLLVDSRFVTADRLKTRSISDFLSYFFSKNLLTVSVSRKILFTIFGVSLLWYMRIYYLSLYSELEVNWYILFYSQIGFAEGVYGLYQRRFIIIQKTALKKSLLYFSTGLLAIWTGQMLWLYQSVLMGVSVPFPSPADLGYMITIPCYATGAYYLGMHIHDSHKDSKFQYITSMLKVLNYTFLFIIIWFFYLQELNTSLTLKNLLSLVYSFGESIVLLIMIVVLIKMYAHAKKYQRILMAFALIAIFFQHITDAIFIQYIQKNIYVNGG